MQPDLTKQFLELVRFAATDLSPDVENALQHAVDQEEPNSAAQGALENILTNVKMARENSTPICQDNGTPIFYVTYPEGWSTRKLRQQIAQAVEEATKLTYLRPNAVHPITGKNTGDNLGDDYFPTIHFDEGEDDTLTVDLILKGGGCENVGAQYKLPDNRLGAGRDRQRLTACDRARLVVDDVVDPVVVIADADLVLPVIAAVDLRPRCRRDTRRHLARLQIGEHLVIQACGFVRA